MGASPPRSRGSPLGPGPLAPPAQAATAARGGAPPRPGGLRPGPPGPMKGPTRSAPGARSRFPRTLCGIARLLRGPLRCGKAAPPPLFAHSAPPPAPGPLPLRGVAPARRARRRFAPRSGVPPSLRSAALRSGRRGRPPGPGPPAPPLGPCAPLCGSVGPRWPRCAWARLPLCCGLPPRCSGCPCSAPPCLCASRGPAGSPRARPLRGFGGGRLPPRGLRGPLARFSRPPAPGPLLRARARPRLLPPAGAVLFPRCLGSRVGLWLGFAPAGAPPYRSPRRASPVLIGGSPLPPPRPCRPLRGLAGSARLRLWGLPPPALRAAPSGRHCFPSVRPPLPHCNGRVKAALRRGSAPALTRPFLGECPAA